MATTRPFFVSVASGLIGGALAAAAFHVWWAPPDASAIAAAMRRETSQQITALSREITDVRAELKRKVEGMTLVPTIGSTYVQAGQIGEVTMTCPIGSQPVSGGLKDQDNAVNLREVESFPDGNKWTVRVSNTAATGSTAFVAFVLCATLK